MQYDMGHGSTSQADVSFEDSVIRGNSAVGSAYAITVAILAQGTSWAAAVTQASFARVRIPK